MVLIGCSGGGNASSLERAEEGSQRIEADLILKALRKKDWDRKAAARCLGVPLRTLAHKMQQHGIKKIAYGKDS